MPILPIEDNEEYRSIGAPIPASDAGQRADRYLATKFPFWSRSEWKRALQAKRVFSEQTPIRPTSPMRTGEQIYLYHPLEMEPEVDDTIEVLWEGDGIIGVYKPAGLPMHQVGCPMQKYILTKSQTLFP